MARGGEVEGSLLDGHVGVEVGVGGANVGVAEPERDDGGVDPGLQQGHGAAVAEHVGVSVLAGWTGIVGGGGSVLANQALDGVAC